MRNIVTIVKLLGLILWLGITSPSGAFACLTLLCVIVLAYVS